MEETGERLRALGHSVDVRDPDYGVAAGNGFVVRFLAGIAQDVAGVPRQDRLQRRTRGFGRLGRPIPAGWWRGRGATRWPTRAGSTACSATWTCS